MECLNCKNSFVPQRATAKFCSSKCRVEFSRKKTIEFLPGYIKSDSTQETVNKQVEEAKKKTEARIMQEAVSITYQGKEIPEHELNVFYRGQIGKLNFAIDEIYQEYFNVPQILIKEDDRQKTSDDREKGVHLTCVEGKKISPLRMVFGGFTKNKRINYTTSNGPVSFPL